LARRGSSPPRRSKRCRPVVTGRRGGARAVGRRRGAPTAGRRDCGGGPRATPGAQAGRAGAAALPAKALQAAREAVGGPAKRRPGGAHPVAHPAVGDVALAHPLVLCRHGCRLPGGAGNRVAHAVTAIWYACRIREHGAHSVCAGRAVVGACHAVLLGRVAVQPSACAGRVPAQCGHQGAWAWLLGGKPFVINNGPC